MKTFFFESIYNTQEFALSELSSEPVLVISYSQEKGKGTSNRTWLNADQALACSLAVKQEDIKLNHTLIPLLSGYSFIEVFKDTKLSLKWPNDIVLNNLKVGGILVENTRSRGHVAGSAIALCLSGRSAEQPERDRCGAGASDRTVTAPVPASAAGYSWDGGGC